MKTAKKRGRPAKIRDENELVSFPSNGRIVIQSEPVFINCRDCRCMKPIVRLCLRHPPFHLNSEYSSYPRVNPDDGCFDGIPK
jgi:hypothetical protein